MVFKTMIYKIEGFFGVECHVTYPLNVLRLVMFDGQKNEKAHQVFTKKGDLLAFIKELQAIADDWVDYDGN